MPELPEVETIRRDLADAICSCWIKEVKVNKEKMVRSDPHVFLSELIGARMEEIGRTGKLIHIRLKGSPRQLLVHLGMTGQLILKRGGRIVAGGHSEVGGLSALDPDLPGKHTHIWLGFSDGSRLFFNDQRQFGYMKLVEYEELKNILSKYGADPLSRKFTGEELRRILEKRIINIKAALLDQHLIAGLGNIYADESLFDAAIRPDRPAGSLKPSEYARLAESIQKILRKAIRFRGTTFSDYMDTRGQKGNFTRLLRVYGRGGEKCLRCGHYPLQKIRLAGRGTVYCPNCQK